MKTLYTIDDLSIQKNNLKNSVFIPTMGNLHAGHLNLIKKSKNLGDSVIVSIFVNRLQFGPNEDFDRYPRTLSQDIEKLNLSQDVDFLFSPTEKNLYPKSQIYKIYPSEDLSNILEGFYRPGFFVGVCTVLFKLINLIKPKIMILGKKDYQQFIIVRNMCDHFYLPTKVIEGEIVREKDGLAFSSRNQFLSKIEREEAKNLFLTLKLAKELIIEKKFSDFFEIEQEMMILLKKRGWLVEYISIRKKNDLSIPEKNCKDLSSLLILGAAKLGTVRLIDNLEF